jgi:hypothetical protein
MTLCPSCAAQHGPAIKAAATTLDVWRHGKSRSAAADDLRDLLPNEVLLDPNEVHDYADTGDEEEL